MPIKSFDVSHIPADRDASKCFDEAKILYDDEKYAQSLPLFYKAAIEGDRQAQERLIVMFTDGQGTEPDDENANYWIAESRKIASEATAAFAKAFEYVKENKQQLAFDQFKLSAEKGSVEGQFILARIYEFDFGDHNNATKWYLKAAKQSHHHAQFEIGLRYIGEKPGLDELNHEHAAYWLLQSDLPDGDSILASILKSHPAEFDKAEEKIRLQKDKEKGVATPDAEVLFQKACISYFLGDKESAFKRMYDAAKLGHIIAQLNVAHMYLIGEGVAKDLEQAFEWYKKAAENGDVDSQYNVALMYYKGEGVEIDLEQAFAWAKKAAENGDVDSQTTLAVMYYKGEGGVAKDLNQAFNWTKKAAENGDVDSQYNVAVMYYHGEGVPQDDKQAYNWAKTAADNNFPKAQEFLDQFKQLHPNTVSEIEREASGGDASKCFDEAKILYDDKKYAESLPLFYKAAENGHVISQAILAVMYYKGEGVAKDPEQAFEWYKKAAENGDVDSQYNVAMMYYTGEGVAKDPEQAFNWSKKAAENGHVISQHNVARMYLIGEGVAEDLEQAFEWYKKAAENGHVISQATLAVMYYKGEGVAKDPEQAFNWTKKAAENGHVISQHNVAYMYLIGEGVAKDPEQAFEWYKKTAENGDGGSQYNVALMYYKGEGVPQDYKQAYNWAKTAADNNFLKAQEFLDQFKQLHPNTVSEIEREASGGASRGR